MAAGVVLTLACVVGSGLAAGAAAAEDRVIRWRHLDPASVASFVVHLGSRPGDYDRRIDVGKPRPDASGVYMAVVDVGTASTTYIAVSARGKNGIESRRSAEGQLGAGSPASPGQPPAPSVEVP